MGLLNKILTSANAFLTVTNFAGTSSVQQLDGVPLGTANGAATGELGAKVIVIGGSGSAGTTTTTSTAANVTATTTTGAALAANANRVYALIINSGAVDAWLALGAAAVANTGIYLAASGGAYEITSANMFKGAVNVITGSSTTNIATTEGV